MKSTAKGYSIVQKTEDAMFEKIKPGIEKNIDTLFYLFKDNLKLFTRIIDKCKDSENDLTSNDIKWFIMDIIGNTPETAELIIASASPVHELNKYVNNYTDNITTLSVNYIENYTVKLIGYDLETI